MVPPPLSFRFLETSCNRRFFGQNIAISPFRILSIGGALQDLQNPGSLNGSVQWYVQFVVVLCSDFIVSYPLIKWQTEVSLNGIAPLSRCSRHSLAITQVTQKW